MNSFDLHMHSCYSNDGEFTPQELIHMADAAHLTTIALSDHNTPKGIADMVRLGEAKGIRVIPAMEFDTLFEELEVHVLGYGIDYEQPYFQSLFIISRFNKIVNDFERLADFFSFCFRLA